MVGEQVRQQLAQQMWRQAWNLQYRPRSSLVIGLAAAKVGFKHLVALLVPHAESLVERLLSPPLDVMIRKVLPDLPVRSGVAPDRLCPKHTRRALHRCSGASEPGGTPGCAAHHPPMADPDDHAGVPLLAGTSALAMRGPSPCCRTRRGQRSATRDQVGLDPRPRTFLGMTHGCHRR